jgi:hypothetical protein
VAFRITMSVKFRKKATSGHSNFLPEGAVPWHYVGLLHMYVVMSSAGGNTLRWAGPPSRRSTKCLHNSIKSSRAHSRVKWSQVETEVSGTTSVPIIRVPM